MSAKTGYNGLQIGLHWLIAALICTNYLVSEGMEDAFDSMVEGEGGAEAASALVTNVHVYVGLAVLALAVLRLIVRFASGAPEAPGVPGSLGVMLAGLGHKALYLLMILVPALGAITWYGKTETTADAHVIAMNVMMLLALGHAVIAIFHQYVLKDGLLARMVRPE
jgi:cytochrome b561